MSESTGAMGKSGKWLKKVKNAFRSPSKDVIDDKDETKKRPSKGNRGTNLDYYKAVPIPLPLPAVTGLTNQEVEQERGNEFSKEEVIAELENQPDNDHARQEAMESEVDREAEALREEQAAIQIQRAFRNHLALKGLVRLQALVRGHTVRRQAATTLRAMGALVRVQARIRARRVRMSEEGQAVQQQIMQRRLALARPKTSEGAWITGRDSKEKQQIREEAAKKRERAMAYAFSQQAKRNTPKRNMLFTESEPDQSHWGWSWMDRWMAARPWENRHFDLTKEGNQNVSSVKFLGVQPKNVKIDGVNLKPARSPPPLNSRVEKPEDRAKKSRRAVGANGNIPLPLPSPPSADEPSSNMPDINGRKNLSPEKLTISPRQMTQLPPASPPEEIVRPIAHESDAALASPSDSSSFQPPPPSNHPGSNGGTFAVSNDGTAEQDPSCSGSSGSEHGVNEDQFTKASPRDSPMSGHAKANVDAISTPNMTKEAGNGENSGPTSHKLTRSRYMEATVSAKAKARTSPKTKVEGEESPVKQPKRLSFGGPSVARSKSPSGTAAVRSKSTLQVRTSLPSGLFKDASVEIVSPVDSGGGGQTVLRRKSFGGDAKSATKWR